MGLFDDDFYSTKISRRHLRRSPKQEQGWRAPKKRKKGLSTWQVSLISSLLSATFVVVLFSVFIGLHPSKNPVDLINTVSAGEDPSDPYNRISIAADKVAPSVVSILNHNEFSRKNNEDAALGSGVIFKQEDGKAYIITNSHVISGADDLEVVSSDGVSRGAEIVGQDSINDIAVLSIDGKGISSVIDLGDSDKLRAGETVIAVGNPLGLGGTLTSGIISYTSRLIPISLNQDGVYDWEQKVIQTDAAINEGNSGGALVDLKGRLIGINTMKISDTGVEGLGFAIPVNDVMKTVDGIMQYGKVIRPYLGVYTLDLDNPYAPIDAEQRKQLKLPQNITSGVIVLEAHGPAKLAGLQLNDVIVQLDKEPVASTRELRKYLYDEKKVGDTLEITFYRDGKLQTSNCKLTDKPSDSEIESGLGDR
ncbi:MAG TPA: trypsin-like peptidase domain-containing protein [Paenibacillus sp.]|jgi:serine protease Do